MSSLADEQKLPVRLPFEKGVNGGGDWWVKGATQRGCVSAPDRDKAMALFRDYTGEDAVSADCLPYPADPRLNVIEHTYKDGPYAGKTSVCPSFCYSPESCKGRSCCPKNYSCTE